MIILLVGVLNWHSGYELRCLDLYTQKLRASRGQIFMNYAFSYTWRAQQQTCRTSPQLPAELAVQERCPIILGHLLYLQVTKKGSCLHCIFWGMLNILFPVSCHVSQFQFNLPIKLGKIYSLHHKLCCVKICDVNYWTVTPYFPICFS